MSGEAPGPGQTGEDVSYNRIDDVQRTAGVSGDTAKKVPENTGTPKEASDKGPDKAAETAVGRRSKVTEGSLGRLVSTLMGGDGSGENDDDKDKGILEALLGAKDAETSGAGTGEATNPAVVEAGQSAVHPSGEAANDTAASTPTSPEADDTAGTGTKAGPEVDTKAPDANKPQHSKSGHETHQQHAEPQQPAAGPETRVAADHESTAPATAPIVIPPTQPGEAKITSAPPTEAHNAQPDPDPAITAEKPAMQPNTVPQPSEQPDGAETPDTGRTEATGSPEGVSDPELAANQTAPPTEADGSVIDLAERRAAKESSEPTTTSTDTQTGPEVAGEAAAQPTAAQSPDTNPTVANPGAAEATTPNTGEQGNGDTITQAGNQSGGTEAPENVVLIDSMRKRVNEYKSTLSPQQLTEFEQKNPVQQAHEATQYLQIAAQAELVQKGIQSGEAMGAVGGARDRNGREVKAPRPPVERVVPPESTKDSKDLEEFIRKMPEEQYVRWMELSQKRRDDVVDAWIRVGRLDIPRLAPKYLEDPATNIDPRMWENMGPAEQMYLVEQWMSTIPGMRERHIQQNTHPEAAMASLHTLEVVKNKISGENDKEAELYGEEKKQADYILENVVDVSRKSNKLYTDADKKRLKKERLAELTWEYRIKSKLAAWLYLTLNHVFDIERVLSEQNKKQQEYIRSIVDTGPDNNERWAFAVEGPDGVWRQIETGAVVEATLAKRMQKKALKNPSKFQALCHYELSKQPEHKQMETWNTIMTMMAQHGYDKYAMYGVLVGLQFMNKPQYLAFKNTAIDYVPLIETGPDGKPRRYTTDDYEAGRIPEGYLIGDEMVKRYTSTDQLYESGTFGRRRRRHPGGEFVQLGDIIRDKYKVAFKTKLMELDELDQEYNSTMVDGVTAEPYESRQILVGTRTNEQGEQENVYETRRYKRILDVKTKAFAHEIAGKFANYQMGFRGSDVMIMLDKTREARKTLERLANKMKNLSGGKLDVTVLSRSEFIEWQENLLLASRMWQVVDGTRMGGSPVGAEGKGPGADAQTLMQQESAMQAMQEQGLAGQMQRRNRQPYPARISGSAEANTIWGQGVAVEVDMIAEMFSAITGIRFSDYQPYQSIYEVSSYSQVPDWIASSNRAREAA